MRCQVNRHWQPYNARCAFCSVHYDFVGKQESYDADWAHVLRSVSADSAEDGGGAGSEDHQLNPSLKVGLTDEERTYSLFSGLSARTRQRLYRAYKLDFELFGYDPEPYLSLSQRF